MHLQQNLRGHQPLKVTIKMLYAENINSSQQPSYAFLCTMSIFEPVFCCLFDAFADKKFHEFSGQKPIDDLYRAGRLLIIIIKMGDQANARRRNAEGEQPGVGELPYQLV